VRGRLMVLMVVMALPPGALAGGAATVVSARNSAFGRILVGADGRTLYHTSSETRSHIGCTGSCAVRWPPLLVPAQTTPVPGRGVTASLLGTVRRPDGRTQVTYRGLPLYSFSGDRKAGDARGQGAGGGAWHVVTLTTTAASAGGTPAPVAGSGSSSDMGSGTGTGVNPGMFCAANPKSCVNGVPIAGTP
jgi:predicted lipoprotein with Yx(FWY)xxD motif